MLLRLAVLWMRLGGGLELLRGEAGAGGKGGGSADDAITGERAFGGALMAQFGLLFRRLHSASVVAGRSAIPFGSDSVNAAASGMMTGLPVSRESASLELTDQLGELGSNGMADPVVELGALDVLPAVASGAETMRLGGTAAHDSTVGVAVFVASGTAFPLGDDPASISSSARGGVEEALLGEQAALFPDESRRNRVVGGDRSILGVLPAGVLR